MSQETISMSDRERRRMVLMHQVQKEKMLLKQVAFEMKFFLRQAIRIKKRFLEGGAQGLVHGLRGMPSTAQGAEPQGAGLPAPSSSSPALALGPLLSVALSSRQAGEGYRNAKGPRRSKMRGISWG